MREHIVARALALVIFAGITACGQKGKLYLPETPGEVVTRPAETPPASDSTAAPNSPQTPDAQPASPPPAPEVTSPESTTETPKKDKSGTSPPPK